MQGTIGDLIFARNGTVRQKPASNKAAFNSAASLDRVAAAHQRLGDALARLVRLNQVYATAYPAQTSLSAGFDDYRAGAGSLVSAYPVVEGCPRWPSWRTRLVGWFWPGEPFSERSRWGSRPLLVHLTGAALRGTNPADGGSTVLEGQVTATGGTGTVAVHITIDHFVDGGTHPTSKAFSYPIGTRFMAGGRRYRAEVVGQPGRFVTGTFTVE